ncbi:hypothetical protein CAPTEDRAFT_200379 [Capitella teleta]|uniref:G-protein coupled receptors family 1 profile domain-containing protein n=1 Tax=Capitella teleta TaxID=283909 RepID=R7UZY5_CAPTE|nr:hypothetical protein CAPTEDRAFT_200379 [Capitella teleta]|eukprot:ELU09507.1 hypothetical protein CAPTEDRAFT_200379 [Capitella teleta]
MHSLTFAFFLASGIFFVSEASDDVTSAYNETTESDIPLVVKGPSGGGKKIMQPPDFIDTRISKFFWLYGQGFNFVIGLPGNTLCLMVLRRKKMSQSTSSLYLQILSITDLARVIVGVPGRHMVRELTGEDPLSISWWYCVWWYYLLKMTTSYNHWIMAGVSIERCIAVLFPLKSMRFINMKNAKRYLVVSFIGCAVYTLHFFKSYTLVERLGKTACTVNDEDFFSREVRPCLARLRHDPDAAWVFHLHILYVCLGLQSHCLEGATGMRQRIGSSGRRVPSCYLIRL